MIIGELRDSEVEQFDPFSPWCDRVGYQHQVVWLDVCQHIFFISVGELSITGSKFMTHRREI
jgi:hypothetical protein